MSQTVKNYDVYATIASIIPITSIGILGTKIFTNINPIQAAIFCTSQQIAKLVGLAFKTQEFFKKFMGKTAAQYLELALHISASFLITRCIFPINVSQGLSLSIITIISSMITNGVYMVGYYQGKIKASQN